MPKEHSPRRSRAPRVPSGNSIHKTPSAVSVVLIERLLKGGAKTAFERFLDELLHRLPGAAQAFLWVRQGSNFYLQAACGIPKGVLEGNEEVLETSLRSAYLGSLEGWLGGVVHIDRQQHVLQRVLGLQPVGLTVQEPPANLTMPLVVDQQVWAVLHLHAQAQYLGPEVAGWVGQFVLGTAPILREVYLRKQADQQAHWLSAINVLLQASREQPLERVLRDALEAASRLSGAEGACLIAFEGHALRNIAQAGWGSELAVETSITHQLGERLRSGRQVAIPRYDLYPSQRPELVEAGLRSLFILPILRPGSNTSALLLFSTKQHWLPCTQTQKLLSDMAAAIGVVRAEWALRRELAWAAYTDPLTGLGNRRAFERDLDILTARTNGRTLVLVLLDLDDFKTINDTYGHIHADHLLVRLGGVLRSRARAGDRAYRLGGDEFALLIEGSNTLNPQRIAERYRALLEEIRVSDSTHLKASLGYAVFPTEATDVQSLWRLADDQMYKDKARHKSPISLLVSGLEASQWGLRLDTPLFRLADRLGQTLNLSWEEQQVLQASCYLLELAMGRAVPTLEVRFPEVLLREAARVLMHLQSPWEAQGLLNEPIPRAARVLQVAQHCATAIQPVEGRAVRGLEEVLQEIATQARQRFDPGVVEALFSLKAWLSNEWVA